jgi:type I restriction enzyme S subunit
MVELITDYMDVWTSAQMTKSTAGRGNNGKQTAYGIKKLRELILELAVRGKLVPQDPSDEPASVLLGRIAEEKARLVRDGIIKSQKGTAKLNEEDKPFILPLSWKWITVSEIGYTQTGGTPSKNNNELFGRDIPFIKPGDIYPTHVDYTNEGLSLAGQKMLGRTAPAGSVLMVCIGTIGKCNSIDRNCSFNQQINSITPYINITNFLVISLNAQYFQQEAWKKSSSTTIAILNKRNWEAIPIPLPPLKEQHRIVAKVDELMALCDQLEQQQNDSTAAHQTLVETLLGTLTQSADPTEFAAAWQRIAEHFDTLFTTEHSIDQLKQTILQLAVMGKLVPQDPNDEPASVLLEKIAEEKARLIKEEKISKQKGLFDACQKKPFELPDGWQWISLSHLGVFSGGKTPSKAKSSYWNGDIPWVTPKDMKIAQIYDTEDHITALAIDDGLALYEPEALLFVVRSGILRRTFPVAISKVHCTVNQDLKVLSLYNKELVSYVYLMMRGFEQYILKNLTKTGVTVESVMFDEFSRHYFMLPPLAEQHRIVAKVDELMALCDTLKARITEAQTTQIQLADTIVGQAVA